MLYLRPYRQTWAYADPQANYRGHSFRLLLLVENDTGSWLEMVMRVDLEDILGTENSFLDKDVQNMSANMVL